MASRESLPSSVDVSAATPRTVRAINDRVTLELLLLHGELTRIRMRGGLAWERGECFPDIACVAAAVRGPRGPVGAISIVGAADTALERVAPLLVDATRRIAEDLFPEADLRGRRLHVVD